MIPPDPAPPTRVDVRVWLAALRAHAGPDAVAGISDSDHADGDGWIGVADLQDAAHLAGLLDGPARRWGGSAHASALLAWKAYTHWLLMPAVLAWGSGCLPDLSAANVRLRLTDERPHVTVGLADWTAPYAGGSNQPQALARFRQQLLDNHIANLAAATRTSVHVGMRSLRGELASSLAHVFRRCRPVLADGRLERFATLTRALDLTELVDVTEVGDELLITRRTCCLAFTVPGIGDRVCEGCCVPQERPPSRRRAS